MRILKSGGSTENIRAKGDNPTTNGSYMSSRADRPAPLIARITGTSLETAEILFRFLGVVTAGR
jgi:hypothetical protein